MLPFEWRFDTPQRQVRYDIRVERWQKNNSERWENWGRTALREVNTVMQECLGRDGVHVASGDELYTRINSQEQRLKKGDMFIADVEGILSSVVYGPDRRTQIKPETTEVVFTVYAPAGIKHATLTGHLADIKDYVSLFSPNARVLSEQVYSASG